MVVLLAFESCSITPMVELYNQGPTEIRVFVGQETYSIKPAKVESFNYPAADRGKVRACIRGSLFQYSLPFPPAEFYQPGSFPLVAESAGRCDFSA